MSTHIENCVVCGKKVFCTGNTHGLGVGGKKGEGGCDNPPAIEFCSLEHCLELLQRITKSLVEREGYKELEYKGE